MQIFPAIQGNAICKGFNESRILYLDRKIEKKKVFFQTQDWYKHHHNLII